MAGDPELARRALALVEGVARGEQAADNLLIDAFSSLEEASRAHAYLCGFMLEVLAAAFGENATGAAVRVRDLLKEVG